MHFFYLLVTQQYIYRERKICLIYAQWLFGSNSGFICTWILTLAFRKCHETEFLIQIIHFITHFEYSHSGLGKRIRVSHQNLKPLKNRARCLNIFKLLCFMLTCSKALAWFCSGFILQSLIFIWVFFNTLVVDCVVFSSAFMTLYVLIAGYIENWYSMLSEKPTWFFFSNLTLVF